MAARIKTLLLAGIIAACTIGFSATSVANAGPVDELLDQLRNTVSKTLDGVSAVGSDQSAGTAQATPAPEPAGGLPPDYTPPAHGVNPHGQGTAAIVDLTPEDSEPLPYDEGGGSEDVVVGQSRGEQNGGQYHGHVTIVGLLGNELIQGSDTDPGESETGPFSGLNDLLADICDGTTICLSVLAVDSQTTNNSSRNSFSAANASIGPSGSELVTAGAAESQGNLSQDSQCQTATGSSSVADATLLGAAIRASVIESESESRDCRNGTRSVTQDSSGVLLNDDIDVLTLLACESGTPDTNGGIPLLLELVCNADDASPDGNQIGAPFGVREGVTVFPLTLLGDVVKATTAASESRARAPRGDGDDDGDDIPNDEDDCPQVPGPASNNGCPPDDDGDDIPNDEDDCPQVPGPASNDGCPPDGDGVPNDEDDCPQVPGPASNDGCPIDTDGDGVPDNEDDCPNVPGPASNNGCPIDTDGDGVFDFEDDCPTVPGPASNNGCPLDVSAGPSADGPDGDLPFTGADLIALGLIGIGVIGGGLALMALADRRRRTV